MTAIINKATINPFRPALGIEARRNHDVMVLAPDIDCARRIECLGRNFVLDSLQFQQLNKQIQPPGIAARREQERLRVGPILGHRPRIVFVELAKKGRAIGPQRIEIRKCARDVLLDRQAIREQLA